jgi:hypothetical protein
LLAPIRRETPLSGGGSWENGTRFRFLRAEKPAGIGFHAGGRGRFSGRNRGGKAMTRQGFERGGREAPRLARTSTRRRQAARAQRAKTRRRGWVGGNEVDRQLAAGPCLGGGGPAWLPTIGRSSRGGGPGRCPPLVCIGSAYVKAQPGGGEWRAGRGSGKAALPEAPPCVCAAPAGARGGQLPGRRVGERFGVQRQRGAGRGRSGSGGWAGDWGGPA